MKVLLINPSPKRFTQKWDKPGFPPLVLGYLAASLRKQKISVEVLDAKLEEIILGAVADSVSRTDADIIGLTAMTHEVNDAAKLATRIKDSHSNATVVLDGCHAIALPGQTLSEFDAFDVIVSGEGEETFCELVQSLREGRSLAGIKGIAYREGDSVIVNEKRDMIKDLNNLPMPAWDFFPRTEIYPVMTARLSVQVCVLHACDGRSGEISLPGESG